MHLFCHSPAGMHLYIGDGVQGLRDPQPQTLIPSTPCGSPDAVHLCIGQAQLHACGLLRPAVGVASSRQVNKASLVAGGKAWSVALHEQHNQGLVGLAVVYHSPAIPVLFRYKHTAAGAGIGLQQLHHKMLITAQQASVRWLTVNIKTLFITLCTHRWGLWQLPSLARSQHPTQQTQQGALSTASHIQHSLIHYSIGSFSCHSVRPEAVRTHGVCTEPVRTCSR